MNANAKQGTFAQNSHHVSFGVTQGSIIIFIQVVKSEKQTLTTIPSNWNPLLHTNETLFKKAQGLLDFYLIVFWD